MKKHRVQFVPATFFCFALPIFVFQFGCQSAQTQVNAPSPSAMAATPTPERYAGNVAVNSSRENDSKQNDDAPIDIDFEIKGVGIGTSEVDVLQKLGKPLQSKKIGIDEVCAGEFQKTLHYSGVAFGLSSDDNGQNYSVISVEVTSSEWMDDSMIKIGVDVKEVEAAFDQPNLKESDEKQTIFYYTLRRHEGGAKLYFQNNKLTRISWALNFC